MLIIGHLPSPFCYTFSMKIHFANPLPMTPEQLLRRAGYAPHYDKKMGKLSYTHKVGREFYPRYHCYVSQTDKVTTFDFHLDQKEASYAGSHMHSGEYDGPTVEREVVRVKDAFRAAARSAGLIDS